MKSGDLYALIRKRYPADRYALLPQVRNGTGFSKMLTRTADAIAMGLWPSRGLHVEGFEIKVNRGDWTRELARPDKAEEIAAFCDYWWVVAPDLKTVPVAEVPANWGLLVVVKNSLQVARQAAKLESKPMDRSFIAAVLRKAQQVAVPQAEIKKANQEGYAAGHAEAERRAEHDVKIAKETLASYKEEVAKFEKASGVRVLDGWRNDNIGLAVKRVLDGDQRIERLVYDLRADAQELLRIIEPRIAALKAKTDSGSSTHGTGG